MSTFTIQALEVIEVFQGDFHRMLELQISPVRGKFSPQQLPWSISVTDGADSVSSFIAYLTLNHKILLAYFPMDAFSGLAPRVDILVPFNGKLDRSIQGLDLSGSILPIPPMIEDQSIPHLTAAMLNNLNVS